MPTRNPFRQARKITQTVVILAPQVMRRVRKSLRSRAALAAENLFLRKQIATYQAGNAPSRRDLSVARLTLVWLSYWFDWQPALTIVRPETFKRWRRQGWRLLWKTTSKLPGRPFIPPELQALIRRMARENMTWGQQRIANELLLKLGLWVSPRTVRKYMPRDYVGGPGQRCPSQCWSTFIRNHATGLIATGMIVEVAHKAQGVFARLRWFMPRRSDRDSPRASSPVTPHGTLILVLLDHAYGMPGVAPLNRAADRRHVERSPPERRPSRNRAFVPGVQARSVARDDVCSVLPVRCWRGLVYPEAQGVASCAQRCHAM